MFSLDPSGACDEDEGTCDVDIARLFNSCIVEFPRFANEGLVRSPESLPFLSISER